MQKLHRATEKDITALCHLVGKEKIFPAEILSEDYAHDELSGTSGMPDVLVRAKTAEDIAAVLKYANEHLIPVVVRGSGTGLVGAAVAVENGIMIETLEMNQILDLDKNNLCVTVQPGVLLMELAAYCEAHGFLYPPDPGEKSATIGGNISTNAGGMRAVKYGVTRDFVRGLEVVLANGEILQIGGKVVKNSTGYSLKDLIVGSEGTLAVITKAILKLIPLPSISLSMLVPFDAIDPAINAVPELIRGTIDFTAVEFMEKETIVFSEEYLGKKFPDTKSPAYLLLTIDGNNEAQVREMYTAAASQCIELGARDVCLVDTDERKTAVWSARSAFLEAIKASTTEMDECDVVVPRTEIAGFIKYTHTLAAKTGLRIPSFGHAGDGNLHIYLCRDELSEDDYQIRLKAAFDAMYKRAGELGGFVSGEHGIGYAKREYMANQLGETQLQLMRGIKNIFDPNGILNPQKVF